MKKINIAIDGPSGVGKSTIADIVAEKLNKIRVLCIVVWRIKL